MDPKWTRVVVIVVAVIVVVSGVAVYYVLTHPSCTTALKATNPLKFDQSEEPDSMDPATTFSTPGWGAVQQVYQTLVMYNGSSVTNFVGVLAENWTSSNGGFNYNFTLWPSEHFSNGDPINAYVMWYSLYRGLLMAQGPQFILAENFWYPGVNSSSSTDQINATAANLTADLNTWNFFTPSSAAITYMEANNQSFRVINNQTIQLDLGNGYLGEVPYTYFYAEISAPIASAVDPAVVDAHGGVVQGQPNDWMGANMLGSGPYTLQGTYSSTGTGFSLVPSPLVLGRRGRGPTTLEQCGPAGEGDDPAELADRPERRYHRPQVRERGERLVRVPRTIAGQPAQEHQRDHCEPAQSDLQLDERRLVGLHGPVGGPVR